CARDLGYGIYYFDHW
nr:immunoglobulin heavy chain junction region [Macaca mulatta]MOW20811.1 immunoglobulin heavy chain junction region [Macaca mulatta]MOW21513.1 immunoglobulin heavy chain junction region [Macaca mulatta]MOW21825.1 immunoglobulin heavy chain junction region [Macaca mulatta]